VGLLDGAYDVSAVNFSLATVRASSLILAGADGTTCNQTTEFTAENGVSIIGEINRMFLFRVQFGYLRDFLLTK
jgi:hypothetical protein